MNIIKRHYLFGGGRLGYAAPLLLLAPGVFLYLLIAVGPSLATFAFSFTDATGIGGVPVNFIGLENYAEFLFRGLRSRDNLEAVWRTVAFSVFVTSIQFFLGLILALILNQALKGRTFFRTLYFMPVILGLSLIHI